MPTPETLNSQTISVESIASLTLFASMFAAFYAGHVVGDHWVQTDAQARHKGARGWAGRMACLSHVITLTATKAVTVAALVITTGVRPSCLPLLSAFLLDAASHYCADRRAPLAWLANRLPGTAAFYDLGAPRPGHDDNPSLGTGAYALDQAWHIGWLFAAALIAAL